MYAYTNPYTNGRGLRPVFRCDFLLSWKALRITGLQTVEASSGLASVVLFTANARPNFKEEPPSMKKLLTLFATLAIAVSLSMPAFAQDTQAPAESAPQSAPTKKESKKKKHSAKKKEKKSKKKMESTEPSGQ